MCCFHLTSALSIQILGNDCVGREQGLIYAQDGEQKVICSQGGEQGVICTHSTQGTQGGEQGVTWGGKQGLCVCKVESMRLFIQRMESMGLYIHKVESMGFVYMAWRAGVMCTQGGEHCFFCTQDEEQRVICIQGGE